MEENRVGILAQEEGDGAPSPGPTPKSSEVPEYLWSEKLPTLHNPGSNTLAKISPAAVATVAAKARQRRPASGATGTRTANCGL